jgi:hypothetical protein
VAVNPRPTIACVLKSGGEYKPAHVLKLKAQADYNVHRDYHFLCLTDMEIQQVSTLPLTRGYPGWWSCTELWKISGPTMVVGLDTVFCGDLTPLLDLAERTGPDQFWMLRSFFHPDDPERDLINGVQIWNGDWSWLFDEFDYERDSLLFRGDENYQLDAFRRRGLRPGKIQDEVNGVYSRKECSPNVQDDARVVVFHGPNKRWSNVFWDRLSRKRAGL